MHRVPGALDPEYVAKLLWMLTAAELLVKTVENDLLNYAPVVLYEDPAMLLPTPRSKPLAFFMAIQLKRYCPGTSFSGNHHLRGKILA